MPTPDDRPRSRIVIVDDDESLRAMVSRYLAENGFEVAGAGNGPGMRAALAEAGADLVVLDLMLPGEDGLSLLRGLRAAGGPPVVIVSARGEEVDRVIGLEVGADDYIAKPFGPRELLARVRAVLRRSAGKPEIGGGGFGPYRVNLAARSVAGPQGPVPLTSGEFALLRIFLERPHQVLSRDRLITLLRGFEPGPFDRSVDLRVMRLRRKIEGDPERPVFLRTVRGEGYLFSPEGSEPP